MVEVPVSRSTSLHRLIYVSRQAFTSASEANVEVSRIVEVSVERNGRDGISGLLLEHDGWFVQALEGRTDRVMTTYGRILGDPRHRGSQIIYAGPASRREFGEWAMCARQLSPADQAIFRTLSQRGAFEPAKLTAAAALRLLQAVRDIKHRVVTAA